MIAHLVQSYGYYAVFALIALDRLNRARLKAGRYLFTRHGVKVVFFGRFVAVLRMYAAFRSGLSAMRWSRFLVANAAGGVLWSGIYAFGAYALRNAASSVGSAITIAGLAVAGVLTAATIKVAAAHRATSRGRFPRPAGPSPAPTGRAA